MKRLIYNEVKKIFKQEWILLVVVTLLLLNVFYNNQALLMKTIYRNYADQFEGLKLDEVMPAFRDLDIPQEHIGIMVQELSNQLDYSKDYKSKVEEMVLVSKEIIKETDEENDVLSLSHYIVNTYQHRSIETFTYPVAMIRYLDNNFSTLLILVFVVFLSSGIYSREKESGVLNLQKPTINNRHIVISKSIALLIAIIVVSFIFYLIDWVMFNNALRLGDHSVPLFALTQYASTPLNITVFGFIMLKFMFNVLGIWLFSLLFSLISLMSKRTLVALVINVTILFGINSLANLPNPYLNPYALFSINQTFKDLNYEIIMGQVVLTPYITLMISILLALFLNTMIHRVYMSKWGLV